MVKESKMAGQNGSIRSFFKPVSQSSQSQASQASPAETPPRPSWSLSAMPSLPAPKVPPPRDSPPPPLPTFDRDAEIGASSDEDDDSSLPDLGFAIARPATKGPNACFTPRAKRTALEFHSSPLTIRQQPKHKFDMKALMSHAQKDDAAEAAADKVAKLLFKSKEATKVKPRLHTASSIQDHMISTLEEGQDEEIDREKLKRALERTEVSAVYEQWYFFKEYISASQSSRNPFPADAANGRWEFLRDASTRRDYFEQGLVQHALCQKQKEKLPDEIFLWVLDEVCREPIASLRSQYIDDLARCPGQVHRLVDTESICRLFQKLDSRWESTDLEAQLEIVPANKDPYPDRDWSQLQSVLSLLSRLASQMELEAVASSVKLLFRLGIDTMVLGTMDILMAYQDAMQSLTAIVPHSRWDDFCDGVCLSLYHSVQKSSLRGQAVACMPASTPRAHELRRRLAAVFLFDDLRRARQSPAHSFSIRAVIDRLDADEFMVHKGADHRELTAMFKFLDIVIDDGGRPSLPSLAAQKQFNTEIDELCTRLKAMSARIQNSPSASRGLGTKIMLDTVQYRLLHSVRTTRPVKPSLYDDLGPKDDKSIPKQREYMKSFLKRAPMSAS